VKVFISSVIRGLGKERDAAERAATSLDHTVLRSEDFGAVASSPQRACRAAVRESDVLLLILGASYGTKDPKTGKSPTHEEFEEAQQTGRDVLAFLQEGVQRDPDQEAFVREVRAWTQGASTGRFTSADDLRDSVTKALNRHVLSRAAGPIDAQDINDRLDAALGGDRRSRGVGDATLTVAIIGAPRQVVLSPARLDEGPLQEQLEQTALYGVTAVLERGGSIRTSVEGGAIAIVQDNSRVTIDGLGTIAVTARAQRPRGERDWMPTLIEEDVRDAVARALRYRLTMLDTLLDPYGRLSDLAVGASLPDIGHRGWQTRAERDREPGRAPVNMRGQDVVTVRLEPLTRKRPTARQGLDAIAGDLTVMLRRAAAE